MLTSGKRTTKDGPEHHDGGGCDTEPSAPLLTSDVHALKRVAVPNALFPPPSMVPGAASIPRSTFPLARLSVTVVPDLKLADGPILDRDRAGSLAAESLTVFPDDSVPLTHSIDRVAAQIERDIVCADDEAVAGAVDQVVERAPHREHLDIFPRLGQMIGVT